MSVDTRQVAALASRGWHVFAVDSPESPQCTGIRTRDHDPATCTHRGKHPCVRWTSEASSDLRDVADQWVATGPRNVGIACGPSGLLVIDEDRLDALAAYARDHDVEVPDTYTVSTGKGRHYYYAAPAGITLGNQAGPLKAYGIDVRGAGGYVVGPGSLHASGALYDVERDVDPAPLPRWLLEALTPSTTSSSTGTRSAMLPDVIRGPRADGPGERHDVLVRYASSLRGRNVDVDEAEVLFRAAWERCEQPPTCTTPMPWEEARDGILRDVYTRYPAGPSEERTDLRELLGTPPAPLAFDEEEFWGARPILDHLRTFARARMTSPWAVLGCTLARVATAVPYTVTLPPIVGSHASLNFFVGIVGRSGSGKGAAESTAEDALDVGDLLLAGVGSGEGIAHQYRKRTKDGLEWLDPTHARLFSVPEIDTLTALDQRRGSTVLPELRKAWAGERLGFAYADPTKRLDLPRHNYRLALVVGIQPGRAGALLDDTDGGTPQRFLWVPATDPAAPDRLPRQPLPLTWQPPSLPTPDLHSGLRVLEVCDEAAQFIRANRRADLRGEAQAIDAHAVLARLKVAALLALLDGRTDVAPDDWHLAGLIDAKSRHTRSEVRAVLNEAATRANRARGEAEGERALVANEKVEKSTVGRVAARLIKRLRDEGDWMRRSDLRTLTAARDRQWFDLAIDAAEEAGQIEREAVEGRGTTGYRYRIKEAR